MGAHQLDIAGIGLAYEMFAAATMGRIAAMVPVARPIDYGVDFYCLPLVRTGDRTETGREICAVQVKGGANKDPITFGGRSNKGDWQAHEIEWLRTLNVPLFIATVDENFSRVLVYSLTPAIACFWKKGLPGRPFEIICDLKPPEQGKFWIPDEGAREEVLTECTDGDRTRWSVDLGGPILDLSMDQLNTRPRREELGAVFIRWIQADRENLQNLASGFAKLTLTSRYRTNELPEGDLAWAYYTIGEDVDVQNTLARLSPIAGYLAKILSDKGKVEQLDCCRGMLELLDGAGKLDPFGRDALNRLRG